MDIIIKGIDITDDIDFVEITTYSMGMPQKTMGKDVDEVIQVPKGHGRIIDESDIDIPRWDIDRDVVENISNALTILEAEEE